MGNCFTDTIPDSAVYFYTLAITEASEQNNTKYLAASLNAIGMVYYQQGIYEKAVEAYFKAIKIYEEIGDKKNAAACYNNIGLICYEKEEYDKAIAYYMKSLEIFESLSDKKSAAACYNNIGLVYSDQGSYETAIKYFQYSLAIREELGDNKGMSKCYNNIGNVYSSEKKYEKALEYYKKSLVIKEELGDRIGIATVYVNISETNIHMLNYAEAISYAKKSLEIALNSGSLMLQRNNYENLSTVYDSLRDYKSAYIYHKLFKITFDSLFNQESSEKIAEIQGEYNTEKKEREIEKLRNEKESQKLKIRQSRIIVVSVIVGSLLVLVIALTLLNLYKQKQLRQKTFSTIIDTEEKERRRFAEDIHDGLGPLLSSISLYVNELHSDKHSREKKEEFISTAIELIDDAVRNTRAIANNLMPGVLSDYGLIHALESFCEKIRNTGTLQINFRHNLKDKRYGAVTEVSLYRVALELINNTIRYAEASTIELEITDLGKSIVMVYADNGKGFDLASFFHDQKRGHGLENITNRIASIGGRCDFHSAPGTGFSVTIEIAIKSIRKI